MATGQGIESALLSSMSSGLLSNGPMSSSGSGNVDVHATVPTVIKHDKSDWDRVKDVVGRKYITEGKTTKMVREEMISEFQFAASIQQYERQFRKWDWRKHVPPCHYDNINANLKRHRLPANQAEVSVNGEVILRKKLMKAISRRNQPSLLTKWQQHITSSVESQEVVGAICKMSPNTDDNMSIRPALKDDLRSDVVLTLLCLDMLHFLDQVWSRTSLDASRSQIGTEIIPSILPPFAISRATERQFEVILPRDVFNNTIRWSSAISTRFSQVSLISFARLIYLLSNNHLGMLKHDAVLKFAGSSESSSFLRWLVAAKLPTTTSTVQSILHMAIQKHDYNLIKRLHHYGIDININLGGSRTPLQLALSSDPSLKPLASLSEMVALLLELGARLDLCLCSACIEHACRADQTPQCSHCARLPVNMAGAYHIKLLELFLDAGAPLCSLCFNPAWVITPEDDVELFKRFLHKLPSLTSTGIRYSGPDKIPGPTFINPLQCALYYRSFDIADFLEASGAEIDLVMHEGFSCEESWPSVASPLTLALYYGDHDRAATYCRYGVNTNVCCYDLDVEAVGKCLTYYRYEPCNQYLDSPDVILDAVKRLRHDEETWSEDKLWLDGGPGPDGTIMCFPIQAAVLSERIECLELILTYEQDICPAYGTDPLYLAVSIGQVSMVRLLLNKAKAQNITYTILHASTTERTPLMCAAALDNIEIVRILLAAGSDVLYRNEKGLTPLEAAIFYNAGPSCIHILLEETLERNDIGAWRFRQGYEPLGPLAAAALQGRFQLMLSLCRLHKLLSSGVFTSTAAEVINTLNLESEERKGGSGDEPSHPACLSESRHSIGELTDIEKIAIIEVLELQDHIEEFSLRGLFGYFFLDHAVRNDNLNLIMAVTQKGGSLSASKWSVLYAGLFHLPVQRSLDLFKFLTMPQNCQAGLRLDQGVIPQAVDQIASASRKNQSDRRSVLRQMLAKLLELGFDTDEQMERGFPGWDGCYRTALTQVCREGGMNDILAMLLQHNANPNTKLSFIGRPSHIAIPKTPLGNACQTKNNEAINMLLEAGADPNLPADSADNTCLTICARNGDQNSVLKLIEAGAIVNTAASDKGYARTPLQTACEEGHNDTMKILLNNNADVNAAAGARFGVTALQAAAIKGFLPICQILIGCGARVSAPASPHEGRTAIDGAAERGRLEIVHYLLDRYDGSESITDVCVRARNYAREEGYMGVVALLDSRIKAANDAERTATASAQTSDQDGFSPFFDLL